jgi:putative ABC transport system permease protein
MLQDLKFALRSLRATPAFTAVALVVLTLGIGATTAIYSVVDAIALRGLPFHRADRLMIVDETNPTGKGLTGGYVAAPNFYDWRAQQTSFEDLAAFQGLNLTSVTNGEPESLRALMISASLMPLLRVTPQRGQLFGADREVAGRNRVALISDGLWHRRFGADPAIVGKTFTVGRPGAPEQANDGVWEIGGVMPAGFEFPIGRLKPIEVWVPYVPTAQEYPRGDGSSRNYNAQVLGRLKDGVSREQAYADMARITGALKGQYPRWFRDRWVGVTPLHESIVGKARSWMLLLLGSVTLVLLIACVNVANLLLARAMSRSREVGVRAALGASRWRLARALLVESIVLAAAGAALGVFAAYWGVAAMRAALPPSLPRLSDVGIDLRILMATIGATLATGVLCGVLPALQYSRPHLSSALREGGRSGAVGMARQRTRTLLLVSEVALAVVLLVGAGLFISSFVKLVRVDLGIETSKMLTVGVYPRVDFNARERVDADMARAGTQIRAVLDRARSLPGVEAVALASGTAPLSGGWSRTSFTIPGQPKSEDPDDSPDQKTITADYFRATRIPLLRGRAITEADCAKGAEPVVVINDIAAERFFKGKDPLGTVVESNGKRTIVGIVRAVRLGGPEAPLRPEVYTPFNFERAFGGTMYLRTTGDPDALSSAARAAVQAVLTDAVIPDTQTFDAMYDRLIVQRKFNMIVLALFGALAMTIAAAGVYGVMAYTVQQRAPEIGVRMALGAQQGQVLRMVLLRATLFVAVGIAIGLAAGWLLARFIATFLFRVEPHDISVYVVASGLLILTGLAAAFVPARRASKVDPMSVLR